MTDYSIFAHEGDKKEEDHEIKKSLMSPDSWYQTYEFVSWKWSSKDGQTRWLKYANLPPNLKKNVQEPDGV